jgi:protein-disulfide isomerase
MGRRLTLLMMVVVTVAAMVPLLARGQGAEEVSQDRALLRLVSRAAAWYPDSVFRITSDERTQTPSGAYRLVAVERECESQLLSGTTSVIVDEVADTVWIGSTPRLPFRDAGIEPTALGAFLESFLPEALEANLRLKVKVDWSSGSRRPGALIPFWLEVDTGYGEFRKEAAVSSEGEYLVLGTSYPIDRDPVAYRRELLEASDVVMWDRGADEAMVSIVEFSDLECPACRRRWPLIKETLDTNEGSMRHGMVSFPLTTIHPWAFRSACASWCVGEQDVAATLLFKELFYSIQREMEVSLVTPTSVDFVVGQGLDEESFRSCYLKRPSLDAVHGQMALGHQMGVIATPTFFVNGWKVQAPNETWFPAMIERLLAGEDLS